MNLLTEATNGLGATLLPVAAALLFEELTCGGLARLLIVPWPRSYKHGGEMRRDDKTAPKPQSTKPNTRIKTPTDTTKGE